MSHSTESSEIYAQAIARLREVFARSQTLGLKEPAAMALATSDADGCPSVRVVLMRGFDERGIVFFTNTRSRKGNDLAANPRAAVCFYWEGLEQQVRIEGHVEPTSEDDSDAYWHNRPRESRLGAWASQQSQTLISREALLEQVARYDQEFPDEIIPRPEHWRGYRIVPCRIEFWKGQPARLHERDAYEWGPDGWTHRLIQP